MLLNRSRAKDILEREKLDGLIAQLPINVYYLSDYWGPTANCLCQVRAMQLGTHQATLPKREGLVDEPLRFASLIG